MKKLLTALIIVLACAMLQKNYLSPTMLAAASKTKVLEWEKLSSKYENNNLHDITYNEKNVYIAVGEEGMILRSTDKDEWTQISSNTIKDLNTVTTNGKDFVTAGSGGIILHSSNGVSWKKGTISFPKQLNFGEISKRNKVYIEEDYQVNWNSKPTQSQLELKNMIWDGKQYVGVGRWEVETGTLKKNSYRSDSQVLLYGDFIVTSKDGKAWDAKQIDVLDVKKIIYTGKQYVMVSDDIIAFSSDLKKWKITTPKIRGDIYDIIFENDKYVIICWDGNISAISGAIYTSTNGTKWKEVINKEHIGSASYRVDDTIKLYGKANGFSNLEMNSIVWDGEQYVIAGYSGMVLTSKSGTNWKRINERWRVEVIPFFYNDASGAQANIQKIIYDGEHYLLVGNNGTILVSDSLDKGIVARTRPSVEYTNIVYDGKSRYFAYGNEGELFESKDGYIWKQVYIEDASPNLVWEGVAASKGTAIAVCREEDSLDRFYYYSSNSKNWTKMEFPHDVRVVRNVIYFQGKYHIFASEGLITSEDGKTWSKYTLKNNRMRDITFNGKIYIGQRAYNEENISYNTLYTSKDLKKWSQVSVVKNKKKYYLTAEKVVWDGKQFVTIGGKLHDNHVYSTDYVVGFSKDGIKWEIKETELDFEGGTYANKLYVAFDYAGDIYTSQNGFDYAKNKKPTKQRLQAVLWDGEKFLIAGEMGVILSSVNENTAIPEQEEWEETKQLYSLIYR